MQKRSSLTTNARWFSSVAELVKQEGAPKAQTFADKLEGGELDLESASVAFQQYLGVSHRSTHFYREACDAAPSLTELVLALRVAAETTLASQPPLIEVVWTYPGKVQPGLRTTSEVSREIIESSQRTLLVIGYQITIRQDGSGLAAQTIEAMADAAERGSQVTVALHQDGTGDDSNRGRLLRAWRNDIPPPAIYTWPAPDDEMAAVHAKVLVADGLDTLVTSANLTLHGFQANLEMGLRVKGGNAPKQIDTKIRELIQRGALTPWQV